MKALRWLGLALALATLSGCALFGGDEKEWVPTRDASGKSVIASGEGSVLFAAVGQYFGKEKVILVQDTVPVTKKRSLSFPQNYAGVHRYIEAVPKACVDAFVRANKARWQIAAVPAPPKQIQLVPVGQVNRMFHAGGWSAVKKEHPQAVALVSAARPGTCEHHGEALVYFNETRASGSLAEVLAYLKRDGDAWRLEKKAIIAAESGDETP